MRSANGFAGFLGGMERAGCLAVSLTSVRKVELIVGAGAWSGGARGSEEGPVEEAGPVWRHEGPCLPAQRQDEGFGGANLV